ncbi:fascin-3 isoform X6 [Sphaerodactylus townsendi]|uniref:fascin-3 isoform X6 n=1 Tax=Sphaerodactylus townsendi TaxID=933632 RepID=UPI0020272F57|nr:fascin-3 isoform X6 [Sphaerodactylus townsendi]XP_048357223.1 fascin-3 isoform X6 [Sphaerodactylus townsendi]XP_048357225.1 fascin-3 isoform X6 [Sphaerodactylus townsendi]
MGALPLGRWAGISSEVPPAAPFTGSPTWLQWGFPGKPRSSATRGAFGSPSRQCRGLQSSGHSLWGVLLSPTPSSPARDPQGSTGGCCRRGAKLAFGSPEWACTEAGVQVSFCSTHTHPSPMMWSLLLSTLLMFLSGSLQTWELKVTRKQENQTVVELRGRQGQALLVAPDGSVRCAQPASEKQEPFLLEVHPSGAWTLQQEHSGKYLESDGEDVFCISRRLTSSHMWMPRLAMHVHVVLFNPSLQLYARADAELKRIWVDTPVPYLEECSFILRFRDGVYHLETANHKFLSRSEKLVKTPSAETAFHLTLKPGCLAFFSDRQGRVLYPHGKRGLLCLGHSPVDSGEWFVVQRCPQWVSLRTRTKRYVTVIHERMQECGGQWLLRRARDQLPRSVALWENLPESFQWLLPGQPPSWAGGSQSPASRAQRGVQSAPGQPLLRVAAWPLRLRGLCSWPQRLAVQLPGTRLH